MTPSANQTRDFMADAIAGAALEACANCCTLACPRHAAEAVLDACRDERLLILDAAAADSTFAQVGLLWQDNRGPRSSDWPPRAGDVWRDGMMGDTWFTRLDAAGNAELVDYSGAVIPAAVVPQMTGMKLISRSAASPGAVGIQMRYRNGSHLVAVTRISVDANPIPSVLPDPELILHVAPVRTVSEPADPDWYITDHTGDVLMRALGHTSPTWVSSQMFDSDNWHRGRCLSTLDQAVKAATAYLAKRSPVDER